MSGVPKSIRGLGLRVLVGVLLCGVATTHAQDLQITRTGAGWETAAGWNYGNVVVGTSRTATFDLESLGPTAVWTYEIHLDETPDFEPPFADPSPVPWRAYPDPTIHYTPPVYSLGAFSFDPADFPPWPLGGPIVPREMPIGEIIHANVIFTPPAAGYYSVYLAIHSNDSIDPPGPQAFLLLEGTGVPAAVPVPGALLLAGLGAGMLGLIRRRYSL